MVDADAALAALACLRAMPFAVGKSGLMKVLAGSIAASVKEDRVPQFGALAGLSQGRIGGLIDRLIDDGFIDRDDQHEYRLLSLTPAGRAADRDRLAAYSAPPQAPRASRPAGTRRGAALGRLTDDGVGPIAEGSEGDRTDLLGPAELTGEQEATLARLKAWRTAQAAARAVPPYIIAHDQMLREVVLRRPASHDELRAIKGFGPAKVDTYGDELLALLNGADVEIGPA